jgi:hypothetical protein
LLVCTTLFDWSHVMIDQPRQQIQITFQWHFENLVQYQQDYSCTDISVAKGFHVPVINPVLVATANTWISRRNKWYDFFHFDSTWWLPRSLTHCLFFPLYL